jgi:hypothetical protein
VKALLRCSALRCALVFALLFNAGFAQTAEPEAGRLGTQAESLAFPSVARVVAGFVITALIAAGAALALRKAWPLLSSRATSSANIRPLGRTALSRTLTVHLVEIEGVRVLMVEGRGTVGMTVLPAQAARDSNA